MKLLIMISILAACKPVPSLSRSQSDNSFSGDLSCPSGLGEISGIDFDQGNMYAVSDGGSSSSIGVLNSGSSSFEMKEIAGASNNDWEDLAIGPCPDGSSNCAYISDLGDNSLGRGGGNIYVVDTNSFNLVNTIKISFGDASSHNVEALAIDSVAPYDLYIIHKNWKADNSSAVWKLDGNQKSSASAVLSQVCALSSANNYDNQITGADIQGDTMVYRGYHYVAKFDMNSLRVGTCNEEGAIPELGNLFESELMEAVAFEGAGENILTVSESCKGYPAQLNTSSTASTSPDFDTDLSGAAAFSDTSDIAVDDSLYPGDSTDYSSSSADVPPPSSSIPESSGGMCPAWIRFCWDWKTFKWHPLGTEGDGYRCECGMWKSI